MTIEQIETFLTVVTYGNITAAADYLYITQSNVSKRLQQLETELGVDLILRQKGHRTIELTSYGQSFVPIASQWAALYKDTQNFRELSKKSFLSIAAVDIVNNYTFVDLYNQYVNRIPDTKLNLMTFHSGEIHELVENRTADVGFVLSRLRFPDVLSTPVYRELMYLVCHRDSGYGNGIHPRELNPEREVYLRWGVDYQMWHDQYFSSERYSLITVNTGSMLQHYLSYPDSWTIAPMSVIRSLRKTMDLRYYKLKEAPPPRFCYMLKHRYAKPSRREAIEAFEENLLRYIKKSKDICAFEPWMLEEGMEV